jgi:hypothetical protein
MVASHLLKYCHFLEDSEGERMELRFVQDIDKREIDFVILKNNKPLFAADCKTGEKNYFLIFHILNNGLKSRNFFKFIQVENM